MRRLADSFGQVLGAMWARKLRSFLTMFGIIWGITSVILLAEFVQNGTVGCAAHAGGVSQSKHKAARRARKVHPDRPERVTAAQLGPAGRVSQLSGARVLERIRQAAIALR